MNTFFQLREIRKYTWWRPSIEKKSLIDLCVVSSDLFSKVLDVRVKWGAKFSIDKHLVVCSQRISKSWPSRKSRITSIVYKTKWDALAYKKVRKQFAFIKGIKFPTNLSRWTKYFKNLLNSVRATSTGTCNKINFWTEEVFTLTEVVAAIRRLKYKKVAGEGKIWRKLFKHWAEKKYIGWQGCANYQRISLPGFPRKAYAKCLKMKCREIVESKLENGHSVVFVLVTTSRIKILFRGKSLKNPRSIQRMLLHVLLIYSREGIWPGFSRLALEITAGVCHWWASVEGH